jgi:hypothetical protein
MGMRRFGGRSCSDEAVDVLAVRGAAFAARADGDKDE